MVPLATFETKYKLVGFMSKEGTMHSCSMYLSRMHTAI